MTWKYNVYSPSDVISNMDLNIPYFLYHDLLPICSVAYWYGWCDVLWYCGLTVGLVRGPVSDELRSAVGQRLAGVESTSRSLFGDGEDSPLRESQRSSRLSLFFTCSDRLIFSTAVWRKSRVVDDKFYWFCTMMSNAFRLG